MLIVYHPPKKTKQRRSKVINLLSPRREREITVAGQVRWMEARPLIEILPSFHFCQAALCPTRAPLMLLQSVTFSFSSPHTYTHARARAHTYVHMQRWPHAEYVNRHLLQYPISSPHHVSDMLIQPAQFSTLHNLPNPPPAPPPPSARFPLASLSTSLPRMSR